jgi:endonuclease/exonuclease/phosphatase family metal-dependent hydrolase
MKITARLCFLVILLSFTACRRSETAKSSAKAPPTDPGGALELRVVSFNLRYENLEDEGWQAWKNRLDRVVGAIRFAKPDIMGVQEALHGQAADLRASLPDYDFFGVGRDDGDRKGEYSAILYKRDRFERLDGGTFWLSDYPEKPGSITWGNDCVRIATWARFRDLKTGRCFYHFNTHWDHRSDNAREHSALLIASRIDQRAHMEDPVVLTGDFNANESTDAVRYLSGKAVTLVGEKRAPWPNALLDTYAKLHPTEPNRRTLHFWNGNWDGNVKIDHILVTRGAVIEQADIHHAPTVETQASDHFMVWSVVKWK